MSRSCGFGSSMSSTSARAREIRCQPSIGSVEARAGAFTAALDSLVRNSGITLEEREDLGGTDGHSTGGVIRLRTGLEPAERFAVLVHELAHERLYQSDNKDRPSKTVCETEAEAVDHVVCEAIGLDTGSAAAEPVSVYIRAMQKH